MRTFCPAMASASFPYWLRTCPCVDDSAIAGHVFVFAYMVESVQRVPRPYKTIKFHFIRCTQKCHPRSKHELVTHRPETNRSEEHTSELQSRFDLVCRLLLEKKKRKKTIHIYREQ